MRSEMVRRAFRGAGLAILVAATISPELALAVGGIYAVLQLIEGASWCRW